MTDKDCVSYVWHFMVEDGFDLKSCAEIIKQDLDIFILPKELEKKFKRYFKDTTGIEPYGKCPLCGGKLLPRSSKYGYFIGCSGYPECNFTATDKKPYTRKTEKTEKQ